MAISAYSVLPPDFGGRVRMNKLVARWSEEIGVDRWVLIYGIVAAYARGDFDELGVSEPLVIVDHVTLKIDPLSKIDADYSIQPYLTQKGETLDLPIDSVVRGGWLQVHRDAVLLFAGKMGFARPTWLEPSAPTSPKHAGGAPPTFDWAEIEEALEEECRLQESVPHLQHSAKDWRRKADAYRWVREHLKRSDGGPSDSILKEKIGPMLDRIGSRMKKADN
jgi:hypothetical protein